MFCSKNDIGFADFPDEIKKETKYFSKFFVWFILSYFISYTVLVMVASVAAAFDFSDRTENFLGLVISQLVMPTMLVLLKLFTRKQKSCGHPVMDTMNLADFLKILVIAVFILAVGSVTASYTVSIVTAIKGSAPNNIVTQTVEDMSIAEIFAFVVVMAPIFEELVFRKFIIDKLSGYGTRFSVFVSAFMFGLIHGNLYQFFYAFGVGALMGYVYCIYGKILYPILIHCFINTLGSIVPIVVGITDSVALSPGQALYLIAYVSLVVSGGILFFKNCKKSSFYNVSGVLISPQKMLFKSWGFIMFIGVFGLILIYNTII